MHIIRAGHGSQEHASFCINRPHGSGDYHLVVIRSSSYFVIDGKKEIVPPNSVILYQIGTPQYYGAIDDSFLNDWIHFTANKNDLKKIKDLGIPFDKVMLLYDSAPISLLIKNLLFESYSQNKHRVKSTHLYFDLILHKISDLLFVPNPTDKNFFRALFSLRNDIYLNPNKDWKLEQICQDLNFSRSYVQHSYKEYFNESVQTSITNSRIEYAKHLLSSTDMKISTIASRCGYHSDVHFMRIFRNKVGTTPSAFRKTIFLAEPEQNTN